MPRPLPPDHPQFGPCITVRGGNPTTQIGFGIAAVGAFFVGAWLLIAGLSKPNLQFPDDFGRPALGLALVIGSGFLVYGLLRVVEFYREGLVARRLSQVREYPYAGAKELTYSLTRQYVNGAYAGTVQELRLLCGDDRKFRYTGQHKERLKQRFFSRKPGEFKGEDELDQVRDLISFRVAETLAERIALDGSVEWCDRTRLSSEGVTPGSGKRKGTLILWGDLYGISLDAGYMHFFLPGEKKSFHAISTNGKNFYPGLVLMRAFVPRIEESEEELVTDLTDPADEDERSPQQAG